MKIAITTTDGKKVDQHFGKADKLFIYEKKNKKMNLLEVRGVKPYCSSAAGPSEHGFMQEKLKTIIEELHDCEVLYTLKIGETPMVKLESQGVNVKVCKCDIESVPNCNGDCKN